MPIKKFIIKGRSPRYQFTKLPPQPTPKTISPFDTILRKTDYKVVESAFGDIPTNIRERPPVLSLQKERINKVSDYIERRELRKVSKIRKAAAQSLRVAKRKLGSKQVQVYDIPRFFEKSNTPKFGLKRTEFGKKIKTRIDKLQSQRISLAALKKRKFKEALDKKYGFEKTQKGSIADEADILRSKMGTDARSFTFDTATTSSVPTRSTPKGGIETSYRFDQYPLKQEQGLMVKKRKGSFAATFDKKTKQYVAGPDRFIETKKYINLPPDTAPFGLAKPKQKKAMFKSFLKPVDAGMRDDTGRIRKSLDISKDVEEATKIRNYKMGTAGYKKKNKKPSGL